MFFSSIQWLLTSAIFVTQIGFVGAYPKCVTKLDSLFCEKGHRKHHTMTKVTFSNVAQKYHLQIGYSKVHKMSIKQFNKNTP